ncbi:MAG TPA: serine/threonine protein phosphatase [Clostridiaceae bacterium]|jgi:predicted phosphohydrolase|nr:serine/threonine protein phosphatase [Clostridiaceae bacterium]
MALYAISDLHLAVSIAKPMDIFGFNWDNYMERLKQNWEETVREDDWVVIPGDISWATYLKQAVGDFKFIDDLPGKKIISKGNHDYWWTTLNKLLQFKEEYGLNTINFMHNTSFDLGNYAICGTRGWKCPGDSDFSPEDRKIYERELQRLELSIKSIKGGINGKKLIAAMHYPPFNTKMQPSGFVEIMQKYNVKMCIYGHLHGESRKNAVTGNINNIEFRLISADYLGFKPQRIDDYFA